MTYQKEIIKPGRTTMDYSISVTHKTCYTQQGNIHQPGEMREVMSALY